jgi:hypothetical protein
VFYIAVKTDSANPPRWKLFAISTFSTSNVDYRSLPTITTSQRAIDIMKSSDLSAQDLANFTLIERVASSLSLIGIAFIVVTYAASQSFHKPINRLVFYASIGNIFTNTATLMSRSYVGGGDVCQFQAFLIQM